MNSKIKSLIEILIIISVFIFLTYLVQSNIAFFENLIGKTFLGILTYILIIVIAIVVAPISSIPLIPLVSAVWGWKLAGLITIVGWTLGSIVAFLLARRYGVRIVRGLIPLEKIYYIENKIPEENLFLAVIFLRMIIPVDILSYVLGLFSKIKFLPYVIATVVGIIPAVFILIYIGTIDFIVQLFILLVVGIIVLSGWIVKEKMSK